VASAPEFRGVPVAADMGKRQGDLSPAEVDFIAHNLRIVALGNFGGPDRPYAHPDDGVAANAARLKAANPGLKVLEYWGFGGHALMKMHAFSDPQYLAAGDSWYTTLPGKKKRRLDITNPAVRVWWARQAAQLVARNKLDGLFLDGAGDRPDDPVRAAKIELFKTLRADLDALGTGHKLVIINGDAMNFFGSGLAPYVDGEFIEWFDLVYYDGTPRTPQQNLAYLQTAYAMASQGKQVWLKSWPYPHSFLTHDWVKGTSYAQKVADMRAPLAWNVAAYLVSAVPGHSFLQYSWGYAVDSLEVVTNHDAAPQTWRPDPAWYPELKYDYGNPIGPMQVNGYVLTRRYPGGIARVDLANHTATLPQPIAR